MSGASSRPTVSVVIITAGRRQCLPPCVESLRRQTYRPMEVVVVVGPSADGTSGYASTLTDAKVTSVDRLSVAYARNEGVRRSGGDIIAFIDDDAVAHPRWLEELVAVFEREGPECGGVGGYVINENGPGRPVQARYNAINEFGEPEEVRLAPPKADDPAAPGFAYFMGANMAFRREAILAVGGFDETYFYLYEDADMSVAVAKAGYRICYHARALVHHFPAISHNRKGPLDLNYFAIARQQMYFCLKYSRRPTRQCFWNVARTKHLWLRAFLRMVRSGQWAPRKALQYTAMAARGLSSGLKEGLRYRRRGGEPVLAPDLERAEFRPLAPAPAPAPRRAGRNSLRVALVCGEFGGTVFGGVGEYTQHVAESLAARGHDVTVLRSAGACRIGPDGYTIADVPLRADPVAYRAAFLTTLHDLSLRRDFDVVEAPLWNGEGAAIGAAGRWPVVIQLVTPFELTQQLSGFDVDPGVVTTVAAERLQLVYAAGIVASSRATIGTVEETYGTPLETHGRPLTVIPFGMPEAGRLARRPIDAPHAGGTRYLFVGRLEARKGVLELARAFAQVAARDPGATLWVVGADNSACDGFQARTGQTYRQALACLLGDEAAARVHFFGKLADPEKNQLYADCDVLVAPSLYESFGLIFLEAMRFGKPVIGTSVGGVPEVVADGVTGLLVPAEAPGPLAEAMLRLGAGPELRRRMGAAGLRRFEETFSLHGVARRRENFYRRVLEEWHGRPYGAPGEPAPTRMEAARPAARRRSAA